RGRALRLEPAADRLLEQDLVRGEAEVHLRLRAPPSLARVARQPEAALGDDVALDVGRAARDQHPERPHVGGAEHAHRRRVRLTRQPWPRCPTRFSAGTRTLSKNTSLKSASPVIWRSGRTSMPDVFMSIRR